MKQKNGGFAVLNVLETHMAGKNACIEITQKFCNTKQDKSTSQDPFWHVSWCTSWIGVSLWLRNIYSNQRYWRILYASPRVIDRKIHQSEKSFTKLHLCQLYTSTFHHANTFVMWNPCIIESIFEVFIMFTHKYNATNHQKYLQLITRRIISFIGIYYTWLSAWEIQVRRFKFAPKFRVCEQL